MGEAAAGRSSIGASAAAYRELDDMYRQAYVGEEASSGAVGTVWGSSSVLAGSGAPRERAGRMHSIKFISS